jgi:protein-tyrosine phosphatase
MARIAVENDVSTIVATPHQYADTCLLPTTEAPCEKIRQTVQEFQARLEEASIPLKILPGAELRMGEDLVKHVQADRLMTLADRGKYLLLELPHEIYIPIDRIVEEARRRGLWCILAHPERNEGILGRLPLIEQLVHAGVYIQITGTSLEGTFGPLVQGFAEKILQSGLAHVVATDAHGARGRRPMLGRAYTRVADLLGEQAAQTLCRENPLAILEDRSMEAVRGKTKKRFRWFGPRAA